MSVDCTGCCARWVPVVASAACSSACTMRASRSARVSVLRRSRKRSTISGRANGVGRVRAWMDRVCACMPRSVRASRSMSSSFASSSARAWASSRLSGSYWANTS